ncbi:MAG TPA: TolC family protein [Candidatus Elarobacter sp.]
MAVSAFPAGAGAAPFPAYGGAPTDALKPRAVTGVPAHVTLEQAIAIAAATSPSVEAARGPLHLASAGTETARVGTRPTFNGTGQLSQPASFPNGSSGATFTLSQLVYDGGLVMSNIRAARSSEDAARQTYRRALQTLTNNVAQAYFGALAAEAQTALAQVIVNQGLAQERLISAQIDAGTAAQIDLQTAHAATLQAQGKVVTSQSQEVVALAQFAHALGLPADADVHPQPTPSSGRASTLPGGTPLKYDVAVATALTLRPDYLSSIRSVDAGQQKVRSARLGNRPSVTGSAAHSFTQQQAGFPQQSPAVQWLASLKIPLYDGGLTAANTATARAQLEEAVAAERSQEQTVQVDVRTALAQLISAQAVLRVNDDSVELARRLLNGRQLQYRAGKPVLELYLNAQANYAAAQNAQLSALYALRQAEQAYLYALGKNEVVQAT